MKKLSISILLMLISQVCVLGAVADTLYVEQHALWRNVQSLELNNPAFMQYACSTSNSQLSLSVSNENKSSAFRLEDGVGATQAEIEAQTYLHITNNVTVWGKAAYDNGLLRSVKWNSVADYDVLYPCILADSVGGDTHIERYILSGGYTIGRKWWQWGAHLCFRGEQDFRIIDPRLRSIVSDLQLKLGSALTLGKYRLGVGCMGNIYRQTADVDFYGEQTTTTEYQMTGLGTSYVRFSSSQRDIFFEGLGGELQLDMQPIGKCGLSAHLLASQHKYDRISDEYNAMPLTTLYRLHYAGSVGWKHRGEHNIALLAHVQYSERASDEHIAGSASQQDYPILVTLTMYKQTNLDTYLEALYGMSAWHVLCKVGVRTNSEKYIYPKREMDYGHLYGSLTTQWLGHIGKQINIDARLSAMHMHNNDANIKMPYANMQSTIVDYINHNYKILKANYTQMQANLRTDYALRNVHVGLFSQVGVGYVLCSEDRHNVKIDVSIGITM